MSTSGATVRMAGRITDWNDEKGYGFVLPSGGGVRAFVHINEFQRASRRPVVGDLISYLPSVDARGRTNARQIRHAGQRIEQPRAPSRIPRAAIGICALAALVAGWFVGVIPPWLLGAYLALSVVAYVMYRSDKIAAKRDSQRTPEATLQMVALLGGWPGALVAQQQFRHKTAKQSFQLTFWAAVVFNLAGAAWLVG